LTREASTRADNGDRPASNREPSIPAHNGDGPASSREPQILAIGMLPPPIGGQAVMFEAAIAELSRSASVDVVDIQAQRNIGETGKLHFAKVAWFLNLIVRELLPRRRRKYDILYYCPAGPNRLALVKDMVILGLVRRRVRKTVYHFHATGIGALIANQPSAIKRLANRVLFEPDLAIRCVDTTPNDAAHYNARRSRIIANGIPDPIGTYRGRAKPLDGPLQLVFIGAMVEKKGIFDLVEVAHVLQAQGCDFVMHFVGEGLPAVLNHFDEMVEERGLSDRIRRHGVLTGSAKYDLLFESDVLLFPSFWSSETQPLAVIEAQAMELPAVAYDIGGIRTIIRDEVSGYVVPVRDTHAFAAAIQKLRDRTVARAMGAIGRRHFEQNFTLQRFVAELTEAVLGG
jgi:glycosyltransferase involved in cell wall biosynthesis